VVSQQRWALVLFLRLTAAFVDVPRAIQLPRFSMPLWHQLVTLRGQRHAHRSPLRIIYGARLKRTPFLHTATRAAHILCSHKGSKVSGGVRLHFPVSLAPGKPRVAVGTWGQHTTVTLEGEGVQEILSHTHTPPGGL